MGGGGEETETDIETNRQTEKKEGGGGGGGSLRILRTCISFILHYIQIYIFLITRSFYFLRDSVSSARL